MVRDARTVLNMKRKQQLNSNQGFIRMKRFSDARQVLKQKKFQGVQKSNFTRRNMRFNSNQSRGVFNRKFKRPLVQQGNNRNFVNKNPNKTVQVAKSGILRVTSRTQNQTKVVNKPANKNRFVSDLSGLTVTTKVGRFQNQFVDEPIDNGDELESMTLEDIPEISSMRDVPHSFLTQKKAAHLQVPSSSQSTLLSRLANTVENTMVADTVLGTGSINQPGWNMVVTNLQPSVTEEDIIELFGHVGSMKSAQLVQPGMALIEYYSKEDADRAYEIYHNRLLDGYPMQCVLQNDSNGGRASVASRLGEKYNPTASNVTRQNASSSSLFRPSSRRVAFTVKLP